ncbi:Rz1-like lysis system protein LysC [Pantoea allii]|uniref:Rz1-like lysis system protein LysC n=1 Tax=Pantoea allii TaxID=574096 RepID=A0ABS6VGK9_9GAMM|nr:Rz1-like lysis system protein LysC [Pantoea allii]MBW1258462.1 Rz1-like lysis system protein LysC [Pantoea allii]MBW1267683.1 Rz1-like lysis system protein LysC [Pantoea allii]MBW1291283.1 Rz1-like lysis system protein LysC [Pantoea allii]
MPIPLYVPGALLLCLLTLSGCTAVPPSAMPEIIWTGCPRVTSCPIPENNLQTQGDLAADNRQLEAALASCGLQVEMIKACQEQHDVESDPTTPGADKQRSAATAKS